MRTKTLAWITLIVGLATACKDVNLNETEEKAKTDSPLKNISIVNTTSTEAVSGIWTSFKLDQKVDRKILWKASPQNSIQLQPNGNEVSVNFGGPGRFRLTAIDSLTRDTTSTEITVKPGKDPNLNRATISPDDELYVTPITFADSSNYLIGNLSTKLSYKCLNNLLTYSSRKNGTQFEIDILHVEASNCVAGEKPATTRFWFDTKLAENTSGKIKIIFAGKTYEGSFTKTGSAYTFDWPYQTGVVFTKKQL